MHRPQGVRVPKLDICELKSDQFGKRNQPHSLPVTPPSTAEPLTIHFAINPRRTSQISTGSLPSGRVSDLARSSGVPGVSAPPRWVDARRGLDKAVASPEPRPTLAEDGPVGSEPCPKSVPAPKSAFETTASSHSYPGRQSTLRTGKDVCNV